MFNRWLKPKSDKSCLILGPRRSGKTTLLKGLFPDLRYVTLDDLDYYDFAATDPKGFIESLENSAIIDEIQRLPKLTIAVKFAIDSKQAIFFMTGSSSIGLLDASSETLAGRINLYSLPTSCWGENEGDPTHRIFEDQLTPIQIKQAHRKLKEAYVYGQFPEVLNQKTDNRKEEILKNYRDTYFTRDLMALSNIENLEGLLAIFHNLARSIGSHLEVSNFSRESGLSFPTTKKYLNTLNQSQLTFRLHGYQFGPAKRFVKASKTYFADNGIIHTLNINMSDGQIIENFVISELEKRRKLGMIQADQLFYYKSAAGREIDIIFEQQGLLYAVEIKSSAVVGKKEIKNLIQLRNKLNRPVRLFLFYLGQSYQIIDDVHVLPVAALYRGN